MKKGLIIGIIIAGISCIGITACCVIFYFLAQRSSPDPYIPKNNDASVTITPIEQGLDLSGTYEFQDEILDTNPANQGHVTEVRITMEVKKDKSITGTIYINDPEYQVVLDPETDNPLTLWTKAGNGNLSFEGEWYEFEPSNKFFNITLGDYYYSMDAEGVGYISSTVEGVTQENETAGSITGMINEDKALLRFFWQDAWLTQSDYWLVRTN